MIKHKFIAIAVLAISTSAVKSQDTITNRRDLPLRKNELGISVLTPLIILTGATDFSGRYTNLTYRHWISGRKALRAFAGGYFLKETDPATQPYVSGIKPTTKPLIYATEVVTTPVNLQFGLGYEYFWGSRFKHGPAIDFVYNYVYERTENFNVKVFQTVNTDGSVSNHYNKLDSGATVKNVAVNKYGFNISYALRYEFTHRWVATASAIASARIETKNTSSGKVSNFDFNMVGILSDISIFYRF